MMDCIRCRRNALYECAVPLPVFSPLDSIEQCNQTLGDLTFIDAPAPKTTGALMKALALPRTGVVYTSRDTVVTTHRESHVGKLHAQDRCISTTSS